MIKIKENKGITIIALIITIVIMLILASVTIYVGTDSVDYSKMVKFTSYMQAIQKQVDEISKSEDYSAYGQELTIEEQERLTQVLENENDTFITSDVTSEFLRFFDTDDLKSQLELDNIDDEIVVNFETREVISLNGIEHEDKMYYTQYNLPGGQALIQNEAIQREVLFGDIEENIEGLNATFTINDISISNGTLSYARVDIGSTDIDLDTLSWHIITNYTKQDEDNEGIETQNITETGIYYFKLVDNVTKQEYILEDGLELRLTNAPQLKNGQNNLSETYNYSDLGLSSNWAYATDNESNLYVWVPRFAYIADNPSGIEFLRGTSDVTTSDSFIDENWIIPEVFTQGQTELTGVWVQEAQVEDGLDIIDILAGTIL